MQTRFRIPLLAAAFVLILASCSKTNKQGKPVPKDAAIAVVVDGASLSTWVDDKDFSTVSCKPLLDAARTSG